MQLNYLPWNMIPSLQTALAPKSRDVDPVLKATDSCFLGVFGLDLEGLDEEDPNAPTGL